ncbi:hypothetical protein Fuma_06212 [Fuerstiella marisgermanici]|uniref:Uncharacterized protein n=1 Tax=Fuerstiella marisgermanici TaxID=1891926 RepID=A0A1P8WR60_9PLAN|nr:hypothetical protein Fuma_06212 [Fuerstiella marisgermanici]
MAAAAFFNQFADGFDHGRTRVTPPLVHTGPMKSGIRDSPLHSQQALRQRMCSDAWSMTDHSGLQPFSFR